MRITTAFLSFACLATLSLAVGAEVPDLIPVQGAARNSDGTPLDGPTDMRFDIFNAETGGDLVWESTYDATTEQVEVNDGFFAVYLGELEAYPLDMATLVEAGPLWLQITIAGEELDRLRLAAVAFSGEAEFCGRVGGLLEPDIQPVLGEACPPGNYLRGWNADSRTPICAPDQSGGGGTVNWADIQGVPATLADGVDNDTIYTAGTGIVIDGDMIHCTVSDTTVDGCSDCLGLQEIADTYVLNTSDTMSGDLTVNGNLTVGGNITYAPEKTGSLVITAFDMVPEHTEQQIWHQNSGAVSRTGSSPYTNITAPIHLPDGAVVTKFSAWILDNNSYYNSVLDNARVYVYMYRTTLTEGADYGYNTNPSRSTMGAVITASTFASPQVQKLEDTSIGNATVDNTTYDYILQVTLGNGTSATQYDNLAFFRAIIEYTYTNAGR